MTQAIRHSAIFRLRHASGSPEETSFLEALAALVAIPGVDEFLISTETSPKNDYTFAVSMMFADQAAYDHYNNHPAHLAFVASRWVPEVIAFMEHDSVALVEIN